MSTSDKPSLPRTVALITGGSQGIGRAIALRLAQEGAAVAIAARSTHELDRTLAELRKHHERVIAIHADVTDRAAVGDMVSRTETEFGPIDLLVNNAGSEGVIGPIWETDPDDWWRTVEVNLRGPLLCSWAVLPGMIARQRGRIVNMASGVGLTPSPYTSAYACSKMGLVRLTDCIHEAARPHGVLVFATSPGRVRTPMLAKLEGAEATRKWLPQILPDHPNYNSLPWMPSEQIANLCVRLARGDGDRLAGRFIHVLYDLDEMCARADEISRDDLYQLLLRTLPSDEVATRRASGAARRDRPAEHD